MTPKHTLCQLSQVPAVNVVVRLQEDLTQTRLANGVVLQVELVETVERILVRMHIKRVDREIVGRQVQRLEHLLQSQFLAISEDDNVLDASQGLVQCQFDSWLT